MPRLQCFVGNLEGVDPAGNAGVGGAFSRTHRNVPVGHVEQVCGRRHGGIRTNEFVVEVVGRICRRKQLRLLIDPF